MRCMKLSHHEDGKKDESEALEIEEETRRLVEQAMSEDFGPDTTKIMKLTEETPSEHMSPTAVQIDETFQRIQGRMEDLLSSIEDSLKNIEPEINGQVDVAIKKLNKRLQTAGFGVFANRAVKIIEDELGKELAAESLMSKIYGSIIEARDQVSDILEKASRGAVRSVSRSTSELQSRIVKMYASISELEKMFENQCAETKQWRGQTIELEELVKMRDNSLSRSESDVIRLQELVNETQLKLDAKGEQLSALRGELKQAELQIKQQRELIDKLDKAEELVTDYEQKLLELSEVSGRLIEIEEILSQRESTIYKLREEVGLLKGANMDLESKYGSISKELSAKKAIEDDLTVKNESLRMQMAELKARWDTLYNIAEDEPAFKAYFLIADKEHTWLPLSHLSKALGIPTAHLKRNLQKFLDVGLIEMESEKIRARRISSIDEKSSSEEKSNASETEKEIVEPEPKA
jgi:predicted transcriptional regulator